MSEQEEIEERIAVIDGNDPWIAQHRWALTGFRYVAEYEKGCDRCHNENLVRLYELTDESGLKLEVGSICVTRIPLVDGQKPLIAKARRALLERHKEYVAEQKRISEEQAAKRAAELAAWKASGCLWRRIDKDHFEAPEINAKVWKDQGWLAEPGAARYFPSAKAAREEAMRCAKGGS
jgi:hypothetical protein